MLTAPGSCLLARFAHGSIHAETYKDPLAMVLALLNSGVIGDGVHGSEAHLAALRQISEHALKVAGKIENPPRRTCNRHDDCDSADVLARDDGRLAAEHCHDEGCEECFGN